MKSSNFKSLNCIVIALALFLTLALFLFVGCSDDDNNGSSSPSEDEIVFKAEASAGSSLNLCVYGYDSTLTTASSLGGTVWTSAPITAPSDATVASIVMNAMGANENSTLKVQIYVNGVLKKEGLSSGTALSASAQYNLN